MKSWISDNIRSVLAIGITGSYVLIVLVLLLVEIKASEVEKTALIGAMTNIEIMVLGYFFSASKDKPGAKVDNIENVEVK